MLLVVLFSTFRYFSRNDDTHKSSGKHSNDIFFGNWYVGKSINQEKDFEGVGELVWIRTFRELNTCRIQRSFCRRFRAALRANIGINQTWQLLRKRLKDLKLLDALSQSKYEASKSFNNFSFQSLWFMPQFSPKK